RPTIVVDGANRTFRTTYNLDGQVERVEKLNGSAYDILLEYAYGTAGTANGMLTQAIDRVSWTQQDYAYYDASSGVSVGQLQTYNESVWSLNEPPEYTITYYYNSAGDRDKVHYYTPNGNVWWQYRDYLKCGSFAS